MAFVQKGSTDYKFGFAAGAAASIAENVGMKPQTLSLTYEAEFTAEAQNEDGEVASYVVGPDKITFTLTGYITDEAEFKAADDFQYDGRFFIVTGRKMDMSNTEFKKGEMTGTSYIKITS